MASGALPPAFPAVRIDGELYWDGGIFSNTPIEAVFDDKPRQDSLIFAVHIWNPTGPEPEIDLAGAWAGRRTSSMPAAPRSHIARQKQIHRLRHVIPELAKQLPEPKRSTADGAASWRPRAAARTMHVVRLLAPRLEGEDHTKDIDFTPAGIRARWEAGYADAKRMLERAPWEKPVDPIEGVIIHDGAVQFAPKLAQGVDGFAGRTR